MIRSLVVSVVIVGHNSSREISDCLAAIMVQDVYKMGRAEVLLIDSGSVDDTRARVTSSGIRFRCIATHRNLGFSRGNNWALRVVETPYVLLLNPDTEMLAGALDLMIAWLEEHPDVGVVAPKLVFADGLIQSSRRRFPTKLTAFAESLRWQEWLRWLPIVRHYHVSDRDENIQHDVEWATGATLLIRREALSQAGIFDESFFMYSEETDLCKRIRGVGWRIAYLPGAQVTHHEGKSSEKNLQARNLRFHRSRVRYYAKHHGRLWSLLLLTATIVHFAVMSVEEVLKFATTSRNRDLRRQRLAMYRSILVSLARGYISDRAHPQ